VSFYSAVHQFGYRIGQGGYFTIDHDRLRAQIIVSIQVAFITIGHCSLKLYQRWPNLP